MSEYSIRCPGFIGWGRGVHYREVDCFSTTWTYRNGILHAVAIDKVMNVHGKVRATFDLPSYGHQWMRITIQGVAVWSRTEPLEIIVGNKMIEPRRKAKS